MQIKKGTSDYVLAFLMVDSADHITGKTGLSPTVTLSKNGAAFASPAGAVSEIANGWYKVAGNTTDSNTLGPLLLHASSSGADPSDKEFEVVPALVLGDYYGAVWLDTVNGSAGSTTNIHGTASNPTSNLSDALTLAAALKTKTIHLAAGSSITLASTLGSYTLDGDNWTLALGSQDVSGLTIRGATVTGTGTGTAAIFERCAMGSVSLAAGIVRDCRLDGTFTLTGTSSEYQFSNCHVSVSGGGTHWILDYGAAVGGSSVVLRDHQGATKIAHLKSGDSLGALGRGRLWFYTDCDGGTARVFGDWLTESGAAAATNGPASTVVIRAQGVSLIDDANSTWTGIVSGVLSTSMATLEGYGVTLVVSSLYGAIQQAQESAISGTTQTIYKTDGSTSLGTKTVALTANADPIRGIS